MEIYLLKSIACLGILFAFYKLFLERENMHTLKRFYLIGILLASFTIPFITFTEYVEAKEGLISISTLETASETAAETLFTLENLVTLLWVVYGMGVLFFGWRFVKNLWGMVQKIQKNPHFKSKNLFHVLLQTPTTPHTFFSYIFLNRKKFESKEIPQEVLNHEEVHAQELHSLDILLIELLLVVFWFNPLLYYIKHSIKLNHEFLADRAVLKGGTDITAYQNTILAFSSSACSPELANSINYSFIKKRFTVMNKQTSKTTIWLRSLLVLPLLALLLVGFSSKETVLIESEEAPKEEVLQEKASQKEVDEYNRLARKYNTMDKSSQRILLKEVERMKYIYNKMSSAQRSAAEPFPELPPPPPPPPLPEDATPAQIKKYKKAKASYDKAKVKAPSPPPPPPPPIPANATPEQVKKYKKAIKEYNKKVKKDGKVSAAYNIDPIEIEVAPVNTKPIDVKTNHKIEVTPVIKTSYSYRTDPSTGATVTQVKPSYSDPGSPLDHIIEMAKRGANFYYEDDKISSDKAIEIIKNKPYLNIQTRKYDSDNPTVHISKKPIVVSPDPDPSMDLTDLIKKGATFYYNDKKISTAKAKKLAKNTDKLARVEVVKDDDGKPEVHFWSKS